jgi:hypothetical protein
VRELGGEGDSGGIEPTRLEQLRVSARGWHGVQLAIIGFIGFCGVLQDGRPDIPTWLQVWAGVLALGALVLACLATFLVGRVAWPLYGGEPRPAASDDAAELARDGRRLRTGLVLTFAALAVLALGTAVGWWPQEESGGGGGALVQVQATNGERWCGSLGEASPGSLRVDADGSPVVVTLQDVAAVRSVSSC